MNVSENTHQIELLDPLLFVAAANATSNGIVITDHLQPDEPIIYCNHFFEKLTGYCKDDIVGKNCRFLQSNDTNQEVRGIIKKAIVEETGCKVEIRNYKKDGTIFWNELVLSPFKNNEGTVTHFIGIQNDITRRKNAELELLKKEEQLEEKTHHVTTELQLSQEYMSSIVETVRESLVVVDEQMKILSVNEHFCKFFNVTANEIIGTELFELGDGQWNIDELKNLLKNVLPANNPFEGFELENEFKEIGKKSLVLNARQITLKGKYQNRILLAIEDITARKEIARLKEDFISIASHEMGTPLTAIKGNVQLMQRKALRNNDDTYNNSLNNTIKAIDRLEKLITDVLDLARMQLGKIKLDVKSLNFTNLLYNAIENIHGQVESHDVEVINNTDIKIEGDFSRLEQVLSTLLSNAVKFTADSEKVLVAVKQSEDEIQVAIINSGGIGDIKDEQPIFDGFYRRQKMQEKFKGMDVGLYISSQIVEEHHGKLWAGSEDGTGSAFYFTLPLKQ